MSRSGSAEMRDPPRIQHIKIDSSKRLEEDYNLGNKLGEGTFGVVIEAEDIKENTRWAVKKLQKERGSNSNSAKSWEREVHILKLVRHEHVVSLRVIYESDHHVYMVMELCDGGNLNAELNKRNRFSEAETRELMSQLGGAVDYLHRRNIVHRDVKLENLLIQYLAEAGRPGAVGSLLGDTEPGDSVPDKAVLPFRIKLTDFGLSIELKKSQETMQEFCGTPLYMAPEIIAGKSYSRQCDVWSVGIIMHLLLTGTSPFRANTEEDLYEEIRDWTDTNIEQSTHLKEVSASNEAIRMMRRLLHREPMHRFTSKETMRQAWFSGATEQPDGGTTTNILQLMKEFNRAKDSHNGENGPALMQSPMSAGEGSAGSALPAKSSSNGSEAADSLTTGTASSAPSGAAHSPSVQKRMTKPAPGGANNPTSDRRRGANNPSRRSHETPVGGGSGRK